MSDIGYAQWGEHGYVATCPTTHRAYVPITYRELTIAGRAAVWCDCRLCDTERHTKGQKEFDPTSPQPHLYFVDQVRYAGD